jgi:hypothetical protein
MSWVDSGILVTIQNGWALWDSKQTNDNPADMAWKDFFAEKNDDLKKSKWGAAEEAGTTYGKELAEENDVYMNLREYAFLKVGNQYRSWLKNQTGDDVFGALAADLGGTLYSGLGLVCDSCYGEVVDQ